jgi:hypothetical protein
MPMFRFLGLSTLRYFFEAPVAHTGVFHSNRQSRVTHPPVEDEFWSRSRITEGFVEPSEAMSLPLPPPVAKKGKFFMELSKFWGVSRENSTAVEMSNW